ncbi:MAG: DsbA family protein [Patescibacteria group bacterium]
MITENSSNKAVIVFTTIALVILALLLLASVYWLGRADLALQNTSSGLPQAEEIKYNSLIRPSGAVKPPIEDFDPVLGSDDAPVTIIYFADFACPYCNEMSANWEEIRLQYGDSVRFVWKDVMLYESSLGLHKGARCAQLQGAFWPYYYEVWEADFTSGKTISLINIASDIGLNTDEFAQCLADTDVERAVLSVSGQSVSAGVTNAPAYFINDSFYEGLRPYEEIEELIRAELEVY